MRHYICCLIALCITASSNATTPLDAYIEEGTLLVAALDLDETTSTETTQWLLGAIEAAAPALGADDAAAPAMITRQGISQLRELRDFGATEIGLVVAIEDLKMNYGPLLVANLPDVEAAAKARDWLQSRLAAMQGGQLQTRLAGSTLLVGTTATLDRYANLKPAARPDLIEPLAAEDAALAAVLSPGHDERRVLRELWPMLPRPYDKLTGPLVADDVHGVTATIQLGAAPSAELRIASPNPSAREAIAQALSAGMQTGVAWVEAHQPQYAVAAKGAVDLLAPRIEPGAVTLHLDATNDTVKQFATSVLAPAILVARESAARKSKMNDMKQIGLAMLNFHDVNGFFPGNIVDKDGKPLLSWRVAILPYLEMNTAFDKFHVDEPWNSPHNLEFAKRAIPEVYCRDNREGMTTYLRPIYDGSDLAAARGDTQPIEKRFSGRQCFLQPGEKFKDITDGTSLTIMVAEVAPEHAIFWTKPDDWEVDLKDPLAKLRTDKREGFVSGYYDGSARYEPFDIDP
ncbi:MAG: DUF1559 domain-containing protein, partial [Cumulibacter sp.]